MQHDVSAPHSAARVATPPAVPNHLLLLFLAVFAGLLCLPLVQLVFHPFEEQGLKGLGLPPHLKRPSPESLLNERFQKRADEWALKRNGFWAYLVRTSNQIAFSIFGQASSTYSAAILMGRDGYLFQPMYLNALNRVKPAPLKLLQKKTASLKRLQDLLAARNVTLLMVMSPNLIALYPERVPAAYLDPTRGERKNSYELMLPLLAKAGVNYLDTYAYFKTLLQRKPLELFQPTGSHLNHLGSCLQADLIREKLSSLSGHTLRRFTCEPVTSELPPRGPDVDLLEIANLLFPEWAHVPSPVVHSTAQEVEGEVRPHALFVGTSFVFALADHFAAHGVFTRGEHYFYFRQSRVFGEKEFHGLKREKTPWEKLLAPGNVVVLEVNQATPGQVGFGFVEEALRHLSRPRSSQASSASN